MQSKSIPGQSLNLMSNILPKKSWHVYNDKNREKVKKDESVARIEKERNDERAKAAEREHRLSILRSRANIETSTSKEIKVNGSTSKFELFTSDDGFKDPVNGEYEKNLEATNSQVKMDSVYKPSKRQQPYPSDNVEADHIKNDPLLELSDRRKRKNEKEYSYV